MTQKTVVGVIGPNHENCNNDIYNFGMKLGEMLTDLDVMIVCGGRKGIMEAVCQGAKLSENYNNHTTIGIIPSGDKSEANQFCDIVIPTGIGLARNSIIVNTADILVAVAGGSGTLSEIAFAWQMNKKVICYTAFEGWSKELAGKDLDQRNAGLLFEAASLEEVISLVKKNLSL
ncbi:TIGR00725 family protein [Bacteroidota bacterium]